MKNKRIEYLDLVKFIAILLVCIGHWYAKVPALDSSLNPIIYSFHMPLFMLVCGYFSVKALELPVRELLIKKGNSYLFLQLLVPLWPLVYMGGNWYRNNWMCLVS